MDLSSDIFETGVTNCNKNTLHVANSVKVVNNEFERKIAFIKEYNKLHSEDEEQKH